MPNLLPREKQLAILCALVEGRSIRSTERMTNTHRDTICRLLVGVGGGGAALLDQRMRDLDCQRSEIDELWAFVGKKQRHVREKDDASRVGDTWTYVAVEATSKLIPSFRVGKRDVETTDAFVADLAARMRNRVQLSSDGLRLYVEAVAQSFGENLDYAQIVKSYEAEPIGPGRYSPPKVTSENHVAATALHVAHYNFVRQHKTLRCTPAMATGVEPTMWSMDESLAAAEGA